MLVLYKQTYVHAAEGGKMGEARKLREEYQVNIPLQMMAVTDTSGTMNPLRFRLETVDHEIKTVNIKKIVSRSEKTMWGFGKSSTSVSWIWGDLQNS